MTSKEKLEALNYTWFYEPTCQEDADKREAIIKELETDLKLLEKYKRVMCEPIKDIMKDLEVLDQLEELLSMNYLVRVYGYEMAKRLQTYLKSNDAVKRWLDGKD